MSAPPSIERRAAARPPAGGSCPDTPVVSFPASDFGPLIGQISHSIRQRRPAGQRLS